MTREEIINLLDEELKYAKGKHGERFPCIFDMAIALNDEVTEVHDAIEKGDINGAHGVKRELAQVAAVCFKALEGLE